MVANAPEFTSLLALIRPPREQGRMIGVRSPDQTPWPPTAEALMRSRFAGVPHRGRLPGCWPPGTRRPGRKPSTSASNPIWREGSEILDTIAGGPTDDMGIVEFRATFLRPGGGVDVQHERSSFVR